MKPGLVKNSNNKLGVEVNPQNYIYSHINIKRDQIKNI